MIHLVLGGARSGKSRFALEQVMQLSESKNLPVTFVATATAIDPEMAQRIAYHKAERPDYWRVAEVPLRLNLFLEETEFLPKQILLIDCLTLWLNNQLFEYPEQNFETLFSELLSALKTSKCNIFLVSNEVGLGVIPMGEVSRTFVDQAGRLNQALAACADKVTFTAAGLPMTLKDTTL
ncbi:bifunctional adenosylcobinamide kinase/adenosylcobinamide-phosphate guanylyltransferase [Paraglaciecola arctica]|uniref:Bifunctional adenosylcobalamin biosynthesis protein n=1 Tax=Paraglaciecola arctica BSs20135 TaxID=493475 RepID=K6YTQ1_9ALTE|nr:bifunctional adenosylcobinamide kinase/adenosylcobinamide-phosphate guanylyltransferase [Paraglaciecola arctica]GAC21547.1 bifunctional adenosylcobalamin biosynthesis protein CobP [Paraglaciecola arctica BSs20135]